MKKQFKIWLVTLTLTVLIFLFTLLFFWIITGDINKDLLLGIIIGSVLWAVPLVLKPSENEIHFNKQYKK